MNFGNNKYLSFKLTITLLLIILTFSCKRNIYYTVHDDTKEFCVFKNNSYWVYQDSATQTVDTVVLTHGEKTYENISEQNYYEYYKFQFQHKLIDTIITVNAEIKTYNNNSTIENLYSGNLLYFANSNIEIYKSNLFSMNYFNNQMRFFSGDFYNDIYVNNKQYKEILINKTTGIALEKKEVIIYWVAKIGIIRYEINDKIFNLINYNIKQ